MDVCAVPKDLKMIPLRWRAMPETGKPNQGHQDSSAVYQINHQGFIGYSN